MKDISIFDDYDFSFVNTSPKEEIIVEPEDDLIIEIGQGCINHIVQGRQMGKSFLNSLHGKGVNSPIMDLYEQQYGTDFVKKITELNKHEWKDNEPKIKTPEKRPSSISTKGKGQRDFWWSHSDWE